LLFFRSHTKKTRFEIFKLKKLYPLADFAKTSIFIAFEPVDNLLTDFWLSVPPFFQLEKCMFYAYGFFQSVSNRKHFDVKSVKKVVKYVK